MLKDLSQYLTPNLELKVADKTYVVPPPSKDAGLKLAAVNAVGVAAFVSMQDQCPTCGRSGSPEIPESTQAIFDSLSDVDLGELSLGPAYQQMLADDVPGPHIDTLAMYALYYWTLGEETADQIMEAQAPAKGGSAPKARSRSRSKSGRPSA